MTLSSGSAPTAGPPGSSRGIAFEGETCPDCVETWPVTANGREVGGMTSAARSPDLGANIGLAMIAREAWEPSTAVSVETPEGTRKGEVRSLPFTDRPRAR